jgi:bacillithiol system protein YtxJ
MSRFDGDVAVVEVQRARSLSQEIERRTGVAHESPQVLVLWKGKVVWNASHWRVKGDEVERAVRNANCVEGGMDRKALDDRGASN